MIFKVKIKMTCFKIFLWLGFLFGLSSHAQIEFYYGEFEERYEINRETDEDIINAFLKEYKATAIEFNPISATSFPVRIKNKKGNWMLFEEGWARAEAFMTKKAKRYSFQFPNPAQEDIQMTWATRKGYAYWVNLEDKSIEKRMRFDEVKVTTKTVQDRFIDEKVERIDKIAVRIDDKWGLIEPSGYDAPGFYISRNFLYNSPEEVPQARDFDDGQLQMVEDIRQTYKVDLVEAIDDYGYYLKGRKKGTQDFGLFMGEGEVAQTLPIDLNAIIRHPNTDTFEVWKDGKVGYYNSEFELVKPPVYEEFHLMHLDYTWGCALKKGGVWQLFNAFDGSLMVEGKAKTLEELQELWLNRG
jgi:hypothetical protein